MQMIGKKPQTAAHIITLMSDGSEWTVKALRQSLGLTTTQVRQAMRSLVNKRVVSVTNCQIASRANVYVLNNVDPE
ncbi:hypothetical protein [Burkholderia sp. BCC0405]|uniref:hypothetical protein n=1 Tax=Burkholderia sp. BCC0405 TaxID=2676298 RepID=UPI00158F337F|nr:hypothetical protein [Burkholderia sp. BCC0405]